MLMIAAGVMALLIQISSPLEGPDLSRQSQEESQPPNKAHSFTTENDNPGRGIAVADLHGHEDESNSPTYHTRSS